MRCPFFLGFLRIGVGNLFADEAWPDDVILVVAADDFLGGRFEFIMEPLHGGKRNDLFFGAHLILLEGNVIRDIEDHQDVVGKIGSHVPIIEAVFVIEVGRIGDDGATRLAFGEAIDGIEEGFPHERFLGKVLLVPRHGLADIVA